MILKAAPNQSDFVAVSWQALLGGYLSAILTAPCCARAGPFLRWYETVGTEQ